MFARFPPHEPVLTKTLQSESIITTAKRNNDTADRDELVKCILTTPHAKKDHASQAAAAEGTIEIYVHKRVAPNAASAFLDLVRSKHFDGNYIFRVVPGFIVQWGIESPRDGISRTKFEKADIDPPSSDAHTANVRGSLNFAGGHSGTGQVYVNMADNKHLDKEKGSLPFATLEAESMKIIDSVYDKYKQGSGQVKAVHNNEVDKLFPNMSRIDRCWTTSIAEQ